MRRRHLVPFAAWVALSIAGCGGESKKVVGTYVDHLKAGRFDDAYAMVSKSRRDELSQDAWRKAMHTELLTDVTDFSVERHSFSGKTYCLQTDLDFASREHTGPYGFYIFYLVDEGGAQKLDDVLTYDRIDGMTAHFDASRERFTCHRSAQH